MRDESHEYLKEAAITAGNLDALKRVPMTSQEIEDPGVPMRMMFTDPVADPMTREAHLAFSYTCCGYSQRDISDQDAVDIVYDEVIVSRAR